MAKRRSKYNVAPKAERTLDGIVFDSKKEMTRYSELKLLEKAGAITALELQPRFDLIVNDVKCGFYKADFAYTAIKIGTGDEIHTWVVEDVKGMKTPLYKLKKKIVEAIYGIEITEV